MFKQLKHFSMALIVASVAPAATALDLPVKTVNGKQYYYYRIQPKETIYSLTNKLGVNRGDIVKYNPSVADGLRAGDVLYFPTADFTDTPAATAQQNAVNGRLTYKVTKGETLYSIAKRHNVTTDRLLELNPSVRDGLKAGSILVIFDGPETGSPVEASADELPVLPELPTNMDELRDPAHIVASTPTPVPDDIAPLTDVATGSAAEVPDTDFDTNTNADSPRNNGRIDIAVMLPFMLDNANPPKQALLYTDFYKGLLMAVDTLCTVDTPVHIHAYDTANDPATVARLLDSDEFADMDVIIAPDDSVQIESIARFADGTDASVINLFAVKNKSYLRHPSLINANIPHEMMYDKAIANFIQRFDGYIPVLLINGEGDGDKKAFVDAMRSKLLDNDIAYREVTYSGSLHPSDLEWMESDGRYVFVPSSGSRAELLRLLPAMLEQREAMTSSDNLRLFGYPEWVILRGDVAQKLHQMNAVIYSRFVSDSDNYRTRRIERRFQEWYGNAMTPTAPMQGTLGYDTGTWIIKALTSTPGEDLRAKNFVYHGLQSGFDLALPDSDGSGMVNESLYFIYFLPDGELDKVVL